MRDKKDIRHQWKDAALKEISIKIDLQLSYVIIVDKVKGDSSDIPLILYHKTL